MRKKLFAILMSAMMMVTFMPAMAFAATADITATATAKWAGDYSKVEYTITYTKGTVVKTKTLEIAAERSFSTTDGKITATPKAVTAAAFDDMGLSAENENVMVAAVAAVDDAKYYYDFTNAEVCGKTNWITFSNITDRDEFLKLFNSSGACTVAGIKLVEPEAVAKENKHDVPYVAKVHFDNSNLAGYTINWNTLKETGFDADNLSAQTVTLNGEVVAKTGMSSANLGTSGFPDVVGEYVIADETTLSAVTAEADDITAAFFYVDKVSATTGYNATYYYDGAAHTVVMKPVEGIAVKYQLQNNKTKKYADVETPEFKDRGTYNFKAIVTDSKKNTEEVTFSVTVRQANVYVALENTPAVYEGQKYEATDFLAETFASDNGASQKAAAADAEALKAYFAEKWEVKAVADKYNNVKLYLLDKTGIDTAAIEAKYKDLTNNIDLHVTKCTTGVDLTINEGKLENEVEFTVAPTSKTYKAKKLKKAAKSFTVKAEALSGVAVNYKLINATTSKIKIDKTTGKITLKKGLKKGTYKFKVKAYVQAGNGYKAASETQSITVKVKK
ncbi:MAG: cadherin repeat domain-containing protein [Clostridiales bacterium]|nr:cadherin repeat domain-containing protein [Candidatus Crickella equi]